MSDGNRQRPAIDLDDLERQLRAVAQPKAVQRPQPPAQPNEPAPLPFAVKPVFSAQMPENESFAEAEQEPLTPPAEPAPLPSFLTPKAPPRSSDYDPLAELARIAQSGNDWSVPPRQDGGAAQPASPSTSAVDALEALLRMDPPVKAPPPSFAPLPPRRSEPQPAAVVDEQPALDFTVVPPAEPAPQPMVYAEAEPIYAPEGQLPPHDHAFVEEEPQPRPRSGMKLAAALVSVAAIGVGAVFFWRGGDGMPVGGGPRTPPVIKASNEPTKVAPANPGGMEVANSNQEIFAGSKGNAPAPTPGKVVTTEEQPVDVNAAAKPRVILPNGGSAATVPPAPPPPISTLPRDAKAPPSAPGTPSTQAGSAPAAQAGMPALGEPKKVRTVLVRPDGTVIDGTEPVKPPSMAAVPSVVPSSPVPTQTLPAAAAAPPATGAPPPAIVPASPAPETVEPAAQPAPAGTPLPPRRPAVAAATPAPEPQVAAPKPTPATTPAPAPQPAPVAAASVGAGDFAVQLAAPPTEAEARSLATRLAQRYGDTLAGQEPEIIRAEVNGKTLYRVRVTGLDRESANTMCNRIKSVQGSCFVAKN